MAEKHTHVRPDGTVYEHVHTAEAHEHSHEHAHAHEHTHDHTHAHGEMPEHNHNHTHTHDPEQIKMVLNRLSRAIGHLESIKRMVESGRDCSEVLVQLSAVRAAINNTGKVILQDHISHCLVDAIETGDMEAIEELNRAIDRFMK
ncbi:MAG: metal-sensing transcriptional repressor [Eubacteriales bacterium]|nr:metal-sensing transcriptional repressor [Eubacteriales bacterium]